MFIWFTRWWEYRGGIWPELEPSPLVGWYWRSNVINNNQVNSTLSSLHLAVAYSLSILLSIGNDASNNHCCLLILFHISNGGNWHQWLYIEEMECNLVVRCIVVLIIHRYQTSLLTITNRSVPPYYGKHLIVMIPEPVQGLIGWLASTLIMGRLIAYRIVIASLFIVHHR